MVKTHAHAKLGYLYYHLSLKYAYDQHKQVITFLQKVNYIGNTYKLMKTFVNETAYQTAYQIINQI